MSRNDGKDTRTQGKVIKSDKHMKVYLSENAFMGLLLSSAEVYKKESLGYLLGYRLHDRFIVEYAFSLQTALRRRRGVIFRKEDHKKIAPILSSFVKLQIIGDFHSHTPYGESKGLPIPSAEDVRGMEPENLYIIIAIDKQGITRHWRENKDGSISGSMGDFFFKISAYFYPHAEAMPLKAHIYCPFPPGLNVG
ncbi:MAG: hypothetical protein Fur0020_04520 [Thermodesulfovibrionia bacterium]